MEKEEPRTVEARALRPQSLFEAVTGVNPGDVLPNALEMKSLEGRKVKALERIADALEKMVRLRE